MAVLSKLAGLLNGWGPPRTDYSGAAELACTAGGTKVVVTAQGDLGPTSLPSRQIVLVYKTGGAVMGCAIRAQVLHLPDLERPRSNAQQLFALV